MPSVCVGSDHSCVAKMGKVAWKAKKNKKTSCLFYPNTCRILTLSILLLFTSAVSGWEGFHVLCLMSFMSFFNFCRYHKSQAIYLESKENTKISCVISSVGANEVMGFSLLTGVGKTVGCFRQAGSCLLGTKRIYCFLERCNCVVYEEVE